MSFKLGLLAQLLAVANAVPLGSNSTLTNSTTSAAPMISASSFGASPTDNGQWSQWATGKGPKASATKSESADFSILPVSTRLSTNMSSSYQANPRRVQRQVGVLGAGAGSVSNRTTSAALGTPVATTLLTGQTTSTTSAPALGKPSSSINPSAVQSSSAALSSSSGAASPGSTGAPAPAGKCPTASDIDSFLPDTDGTGWPAIECWKSFESLASTFKPIMGTNCVSGANNKPGESEKVISAIEKVSGEIGIDKRFILAAVIQESNGCLRVETTSVANPNPGLLQSHEGVSCAKQDTCDDAKIEQMIRDGADQVAPDKRGYLAIAKLYNFPLTEAKTYYQIARMYNSGENIQYPNINAGTPGTTDKYCKDFAKRLTLGI